MRKKTIEQYIETIFEIQEQKKKVHTNDVASSLDINPASVTEMFQKLEKLGYINYEKYGGVTLTKNGEDIAINIRKKHDTLYKFLQIFDIPEDIANEDACHIEHVVHKKTMLRLTQFVEFINSYDKKPRWLEHFQYYYKTGTMPRCDRIRNFK